MQISLGPKPCLAPQEPMLGLVTGKLEEMHWGWWLGREDGLTASFLREREGGGLARSGLGKRKTFL